MNFWDKVDKSADCWTWTGSCGTEGYGVLRVGGKEKKPHRVSFAMAHPGTDLEGLQVHHLCENKLCVNADHLEALEPSVHQTLHHCPENKCIRGHLLDAANTLVSVRKGREERSCRACAYERSRAYRERNIERIRERDRARWHASNQSRSGGDA